MDEAHDRLVQCDAGGDEDREDDREPGEALTADTPQRKKAIPSGTAVRASPVLWIRSASSATECEKTKIAT